MVAHRQLATARHLSLPVALLIMAEARIGFRVSPTTAGHPAPSTVLALTSPRIGSNGRFATTVAYEVQSSTQKTTFPH
eukprot:3725465-Prymnesium_polylepis.1